MTDIRARHSIVPFRSTVSDVHEPGDVRALSDYTLSEWVDRMERSDCSLAQRLLISDAVAEQAAAAVYASAKAFGELVSPEHSPEQEDEQAAHLETTIHQAITSLVASGLAFDHEFIRRGAGTDDPAEPSVTHAPTGLSLRAIAEKIVGTSTVSIDQLIEWAQDVRAARESLREAIPNRQMKALTERFSSGDASDPQSIDKFTIDMNYLSHELHSVNTEHSAARSNDLFFGLSRLQPYGDRRNPGRACAEEIKKLLGARQDLTSQIDFESLYKAIQFHPGSNFEKAEYLSQMLAQTGFSETYQPDKRAMIHREGKPVGQRMMATLVSEKVKKTTVTMYIQKQFWFDDTSSGKNRHARTTSIRLLSSEKDSPITSIQLVARSSYIENYINSQSFIFIDSDFKCVGDLDESKYWLHWSQFKQIKESPFIDHRKKWLKRTP
jgi:hypothetical protein